MSADGEWDESTAHGYKTIPVLINTMKGDHLCPSFHRYWDTLVFCDRNVHHTGRHLATERLGRYPVAVWR